MSERIATVIGSTGMIGTSLVEHLLKDGYYPVVRVLVRRPIEKADPRMEIKLIDFNDTESFKLALEGSSAIFCAIGTTQQKVSGNNDQYRNIDFDIPFKAAKLGKETVCENFIIITSVGANSKSKQFYIRLKGELEDALAGLNLHSVHIMQPSMLLGKRTEHRAMEGFLQGTMKAISGLLIGSWRKFRAMDADTLAKAMIAASKKDVPGFFRHTFDGIKELGG